MTKCLKNADRNKCIKSDCRNSKNIDINKILVIPFGDLTEKIYKLFDYFLYNAPDIKSVHSQKIPVYLHSELFAQMIENRHFYYRRFCASNATIKNELEKGNLFGDMLCLKCKRYVCKKRKTEKNKLPESDLDCFLRHIRNAIAHGRVYYLHGGNKIHIVFEDANNSGIINARIVCIKADLEHWKKVLENPKNYMA